MTILQNAKSRLLRSPLVAALARQEGVSSAFLLANVAAGRTVIPHNRNRRISRPCAIGAGLRVKINANIGTSTEKRSLGTELKKLHEAVRLGADTVMDLSVGGDLRAVRRRILSESSVPVGTVPIYEVSVGAMNKSGDPLGFAAEDIFSVLERQAEEGVDFFTIHSGVNRKTLADLKKSRRLLGIVSRGGALLASWMDKTGQENPLYEQFDRVLEIAYKHDVTLSLGDGLRPGSVLDANDRGQFSELAVLGKLARRAYARGVQVMIEGPGHVPLNRVQENIERQKKLCRQAPFYVLGPLVTDIAAGYDHISAAIGGCLAAVSGADFLCYVTPAEHLRLPTIDDVRQGVIAAKISAHAADVARGLPSAVKRDREMSCARAERDWKRQIMLSIDPDKARAYRASSQPGISDVCTMCGKFCSIKMMERCGKGKK